MSAAAGLAVPLAIVALAAPATAATPRTNLPDVEDEVMCTICGTLLAESDSPQAESERNLIRKLIAEGETKDEIKDALVAQYGANVLATPSDSGFDLLAWLVPGVGIALAGLLVGRFALTRRHAGEPKLEEQLDPADRKRLDEDLSSYKL